MDSRMPHIGCKYFARRSLSPTLEMGSIGQNSTFSEHGHVAYQLNGITKCSLMVANILQQTPLLTLGVKRPKFNFFRTMLCCISNVRESRLQQHGSKYFARRPLPLPNP